nr:immunoglobulin heavy chain junction region [Mus musculus]
CARSYYGSSYGHYAMDFW